MSITAPTKHLNSILDWDPREISSLHTVKKSRSSSLVKLSLLHKRVFLQDIQADVHGQYSTEKRYIAYLTDAPNNHLPHSGKETFHNHHNHPRLEGQAGTSLAPAKLSILTYLQSE